MDGFGVFGSGDLEGFEELCEVLRELALFVEVRDVRDEGRPRSLLLDVLLVLDEDAVFLGTSLALDEAPVDFTDFFSTGLKEVLNRSGTSLLPLRR